MVPNFVQIDDLDYKQNLKQIENAGVSFPMGELTISFQPVPEAFGQWSVPLSERPEQANFVLYFGMVRLKYLY